MIVGDATADRPESSLHLLVGEALDIDGHEILQVTLAEPKHLLQVSVHVVIQGGFDQIDSGQRVGVQVEFGPVAHLRDARSDGVGSLLQQLAHARGVDELCLARLAAG